MPKCITLCFWSRNSAVPLTSCCRFRLTGRKVHAGYVNQLPQEADVQFFINKIWRDWLFLQALKCVHSLTWNANKMDWDDLQVSLQKYQTEGWKKISTIFFFFSTNKGNGRFLMEIAGKGSFEHRNHPPVTNDLHPPFSLPAALGAPNSNLSSLYTISPRPRLICEANK